MKIALVCTHGGHLTETLQILDAFIDHQIFLVTHNSSRDNNLKDIFPVYFSQTIDAKIHRFLFSFLWAYKIIKNEKPDVIFSMGAEIAIPFMVWAKVLRIKTIYIESWCRIKDLSLTAKLVYPLVDEFWVQWPETLTICGPKGKYNGAVV